MTFNINLHVDVPPAVLKQISDVLTAVTHIASVVDELLARSKAIVGVDAVHTPPTPRT